MRTLLRALAFTLAAAIVAACGRQVTGLGTAPGQAGGNSLPAGQMLLRFRTAFPMDFNNFRYLMVFNTNGTGTEPYANAYQTGFLNYSFAWVVGGSGGTVAQPTLIQYYLLPGTTSGLGSRQIFYAPQSVQFDPNSNGSFTEFTIIFNRAIFNQPNPTTPTPGPGATPAPSPMAARLWFLNYITTDAQGNPVDAEGVQGKNDVSYVLQLDTATSFDISQQLTVPAGAITLPASQQAAQIAGGEVINSP